MVLKRENAEGQEKCENKKPHLEKVEPKNEVRAKKRGKSQKAERPKRSVKTDLLFKK